MNIALLKIGRIIYAIPFAIFGLFHFMNAGAMAGMVPLPGGVFWVYLTGVALIAASVAILINRYARLACQLLGVMLFIFALSIHLPGVLGAADEAAMALSMTSLLKDIALGGAAWAISDTFAPQTGATAA
ncbi:MAG: DoxX family membrane protein [Bacteroidetes bacterium]|nr:MAG: DoxX family membrane protein [Bacteroidota bacterium]